MSDPPLFQDVWNFDDPAQSAAAFRNLLPQIEASGDRLAHLQLLTQIARTHSLQQQFDAAHALLDQVEAQLDDDVPIAKIRCLLERGRTFNSAGQPERARPLFVEAYELSRVQGADFYAVDAAHMMGIAAETADARLDWNKSAAALAEQSENRYAQGWLGSLYNNLGWSYHDRGEYDRALGWFERAETHFRERQPNEARARVARWCIARTLRSLGEVDEALAMQRAQHEEYQALGQEDGYVYEEIGECLLLLGQAELARPYFGEAHRVLSQDRWLRQREPNRLSRLQALSAAP